MNLIIGLVFIIAGFAFIFYFRPKAKAKLLEMQYLQTKTVKELLESFESMKLSGLENTYKEFVELKGRIVGNGVRTPFSERLVAYYDSKLYRVNEVKSQKRDKNGNIINTVDKQEDLISSEKSNHYIEFQDNSCDETILLDINDSSCSFDITKTFDRFEYDRNMSQYSYFNSSPYSNRHNYSNNGLGITPLGYRMEENTVDLNQNLYVIGGAYYNAGKLHIGRPVENGKPFLVSCKSEEELINSSKQTIMLLLGGGILAIVIGLFTIVSHLL